MQKVESTAYRMMKSKMMRKVMGTAEVFHVSSSENGNDKYSDTYKQ